MIHHSEILLLDSQTTKFCIVTRSEEQKNNMKSKMEY